MNAQPLQPEDSEALVLQVSVEVMTRLEALALEMGIEVSQLASTFLAEHPAFEQSGTEESRLAEQEWEELLRIVWDSNADNYPSRDELHER